jgi:hypothetical protein
MKYLSVKVNINGRLDGSVAKLVLHIVQCVVVKGE